MSAPKTSGAQIFTFYSYKGGTGRSMAVANIAWVLASAGKRVLVIDWDLEAPGLHRYFRPFLIDEDLESSPGVIDFVVNYASQAVIPSSTETPDKPDWYVEHADITAYAVGLEWSFPEDGSIAFIPAGRQDATYATRVSTFNWANFYERLGGGALIEAMRRILKRSAAFDFVLIDSRTGVSDTAGICTIQLPDALAVCFTYNNQSTDGALAVAMAAQQQRAAPSDGSAELRTLKVFPIPMRVDPFESGRLNARRAYAWKRFAPLIGHLSSSSPRQYWSEVEVPYVPAFSYEEILATFRDDPEDPKSVLGAFVRIAGYLTPSVQRFALLASPEERKQVLARFAVIGEEIASAPDESTAEATIRIAEGLYGRLDENQREDARRLWLSLVRVSEAYEVADLASVRVAEADLGRVDSTVIDVFVDGGLLLRERNKGGIDLMAASSAVLQWPRLIEWVRDRREFLVWRQRLRGSIERWNEKDRPSELLLSGSALAEASKALSRTRAELLVSEIDFIQTSRRHSVLTKVLATAAAALVLVFVVREFLKPRSEVPAATSTSQASLVEPAQTDALLLRVENLNDPLPAALLLSEIKSPVDNESEWVRRLAPVWQHPIPRAVLRGHDLPITSLAYSPDSRLIVSSANDGRIAVWSVSNGAFSTWLQAGPLAVRGDSRIRGEYELVAMQPPSVGEDARTHAAFLGPDRIITSGRQGTLRVFDARSGKALMSRRDNRFASAPLLASNGEFLAMAGGKVVAVVRSSDLGPDIASRNFRIDITDVSMARRGDTIALAAGRAWLFPSGATSGIGLPGIARLARVDAAGEILAWTGDSSVHVTNSDMKELAVLQHPLPVNAMDIDGSGKLVATGADDAILRIWDVAAKTAREIKTGHDGPITSIAFDLSGKEVATGSADGTVRLWAVDWAPVVPTTVAGGGQSLAARTSACLTAAQRIQLLNEPPDTAESQFRACEQKNGRIFTPSQSL